MKIRNVLLPAILLLGLVLTGCSTDPSGTGAVYTVKGTVSEAGTGGIPLEGVTVTLDDTSVTTQSDGHFEFSDVAAGTYNMTASLTGYTAEQKTVSVSGTTDVAFELEPSGGRIVATGALADMLNDLDGTETEDSKITLSGNIADLMLPEELEPGSLAPQSTAITITTLQALVNGVVYPISIGSDGRFSQDVPVNPGPNTVQLRVFSEEGHAHSTEAITVTVTFDRLDLRVLLRWDTTGSSDVDIHMFQRNGSETPPIPVVGGSGGDWWSRDRHVYYSNKTPTDFGSATDQNPFLDIDNMEGYGPETIILQEAPNGEYHVWVHFYNQGSDPVTNATVDVTVNQPGRAAPLTRRFEKQLTEDWEYWYVTTVSFPDGNFMDLGLEPVAP